MKKGEPKKAQKDAPALNGDKAEKGQEKKAAKEKEEPTGNPQASLNGKKGSSSSQDSEKGEREKEGKEKEEKKGKQSLPNREKEGG